MNNVARMHLVVRNDSNGQEYLYENVSDALLGWCYDAKGLGVGISDANTPGSNICQGTGASPRL